MSNLVHGLAFGIPKFYIVPYGKINCRFVNLSHNCDVKSGLKVWLNKLSGSGCSKLMMSLVKVSLKFKR